MDLVLRIRRNKLEKSRIIIWIIRLFALYLQRINSHSKSIKKMVVVNKVEEMFFDIPFNGLTLKDKLGHTFFALELPDESKVLLVNSSEVGTVRRIEVLDKLKWRVRNDIRHPEFEYTYTMDLYFSVLYVDIKTYADFIKLCETPYMLNIIDEYLIN